MTASKPTSDLPPEPQRKPGRDADEIERDIEQSRQRLAVTVDELSERVRPGNVAARLKSRARGLVLDEQGGLRFNRVGPVAGAVVGLVLLKVWRVRANRPKTRAERLADAVASASEAARGAIVSKSAAARDVVVTKSGPARDALVSGAETAHGALVSGAGTAHNALVSGAGTAHNALTSGVETGRDHLTSAVSTVAAATDTAKEAAVGATKGTWGKARRLRKSLKK